MTIEKNLEEMFGKVFLSFFFLILSYPILEGMVSKSRENSKLFETLSSGDFRMWRKVVQGLWYKSFYNVKSVFHIGNNCRK